MALSGDNINTLEARVEEASVECSDHVKKKAKVTPVETLQQDKERYSTNEDLSIVVEGGVVPVYSQVLIAVSPVFEKMLSANMSECASGKVELKYKTKSEFETFWDVLTWKAPVTQDNSMFLSIWADEYQIDNLKTLCENHLMNMPCTCPALEHAIQYHLPRREAQCMKAISAHIRAHFRDLTSMGTQVSDELMQKLWPVISRVLKMDIQMPDGFNPGHPFWPVLVKAANSIPVETCKSWPQKLYNLLPSTNNADSKARQWMQDELKAFDF